MIVKLLLFASARDAIGKNVVDFEIDDRANVGDLRRSLLERYPALLTVLGQCSISIDQQYANDDSRLHHGAEVGLIPPVSGG